MSELGPARLGARIESMFIFTNRLGCLGSLLVSVVLTALLYLLLSR